MATTVTALSAPSAGAAFQTTRLTRRDLRPDDVEIEIKYAGICHSDIHQVRDEWGGADFPLTPGHEIAGVVSAVGPEVTRFAVGDTVGVGCYADSCLACEPCGDGEEQFCDRGVVLTYGGKDYEGERTHGGYSQGIVIREHFVVRIPDGVDLAATAPLLCAGITTYSPLKRYGAGPGVRVGVIGMGGLGHVAVKIAAALGAEVSVFSRTDAKAEDGKRFGASSYYATGDGYEALKPLRGSFDLLLNTVGDAVSLDAYLDLLGRGGTLVNLGLPSDRLQLRAFSLLRNRRNYAGSLVGGIPETQEMLDFCAEHGITATIELIDAAQTTAYYDKVVAGEVRYRAVIDVATLTG